MFILKIIVLVLASGEGSATLTPGALSGTTWDEEEEKTDHPVMGVGEPFVVDDPR